MSHPERTGAATVPRRSSTSESMKLFRRLRALQPKPKAFIKESHVTRILMAEIIIIISLKN
jgi:hypothetical protein|tara:strand:+ start:299 stop:481 length:183 start_codon:yes stop_codon:yes gene_type:complete